MCPKGPTRFLLSGRPTPESLYKRIGRPRAAISVDWFGDGMITLSLFFADRSCRVSITTTSTVPSAVSRANVDAADDRPHRVVRDADFLFSLLLLLLRSLALRALLGSTPPFPIESRGSASAEDTIPYHMIHTHRATPEMAVEKRTDSNNYR